MTSNTDSQNRRRRAAAILAGGLVVGIGTMATLASWNDSEYAQATYTAGTFNLQGSTDGVDYTDHLGTAASPTAALPFTAPFDHLSPTDSIYAPLAVRLAQDTTYAADASVQVTDLTGTMGDNLNYAIYATPAFGCTSAADLAGATELVSSRLLQIESGAAATFELAKPAAAAPGDSVNLCIVVTAGSALEQDTAGTATWRVAAASKTA